MHVGKLGSWALWDLECGGLERSTLLKGAAVTQLQLILPFGNENPSVIDVLFFLFFLKEEPLIWT